VIAGDIILSQSFFDSVVAGRGYSIILFMVEWKDIHESNFISLPALICSAQNVVALNICSPCCFIDPDGANDTPNVFMAWSTSFLLIRKLFP
jgi:hypothetical protein